MLGDVIYVRMRIFFEFFFINVVFVVVLQGGIIKFIYVFYINDFNFEDDILMYDINGMGVRSVFLFNIFENVFELFVDVEFFDFKMNKVIIVFVVKEN